MSIHSKTVLLLKATVHTTYHSAGWPLCVRLHQVSLLHWAESPGVAFPFLQMHAGVLSLFLSLLTEHLPPYAPHILSVSPGGSWLSPLWMQRMNSDILPAKAVPIVDKLYQHITNTQLHNTKDGNNRTVQIYKACMCIKTLSSSWQNCHHFHFSYSMKALSWLM